MSISNVNISNDDNLILIIILSHCLADDFQEFLNFIQCRLIQLMYM
jgi:hypothetical protein